MRTIFGFIFIIGGIVLAIWLGFVVMLYGGIMAAVDNLGTDNSAAVWGNHSSRLFHGGCCGGCYIC